jgi:hypothetical protein
LCMRWKRRGVGCWHAEPPVESADCGAESSAKPRKDASKIFKRRIGTSGHSPEGYASGNFERASLRVVMKILWEYGKGKSGTGGGHSTRDLPSSGHLRFASQEYNTPVRRWVFPQWVMLKKPDIAVFSWAKQIGLTFAL